MPALPPVPKVLRVDLIQTNQSNTRIRDRFFLQYTGSGPSVADLNTLATTIANAWSATLASETSNLASLTGVEITDLNSATGAQTERLFAFAGSVAGAFSPAGVAAVVKFKISRRYRGGHPRFYFGNLNNADLATSTTLSSSFQSSLATSFAAFIGDCVTTPPTSLGTLTHVNVSYFSGFHNITLASGRQRSVPTLRGTPLVDAVVAYSVNPQVGSQRRRNQQSA